MDELGGRLGHCSFPSTLARAQPPRALARGSRAIVLETLATPRSLRTAQAYTWALAAWDTRALLPQPKQKLKPQSPALAGAGARLAGRGVLRGP